MSFTKDRTFTQPVVWITTIIMIAFHIGAVAALFFFSWQALVLAMGLWWIAGGLGIGVGYHRLLTHHGFKTFRWMEYLLTISATLALEGGPIFWVGLIASIIRILIRRVTRTPRAKADSGPTPAGC